MFKVIEDVSKLTTIPTKSLSQLSDIIIYCIVDAVKEDNLEGKEITELDLGFGTLCVNHVGRQLKYKFIPSANLNSQMCDMLDNKLNSLENILETNLVNKIVNTYKDLI